MIGLKIIMNGDNAWPDLKDKKVVEVTEPIEVAILDKGMASGKPSVTVRLDLPDGTACIAQTSGKLIAALGRVLLSRYPKLLDD